MNLRFASLYFCVMYVTAYTDSGVRGPSLECNLLLSYWTGSEVCRPWKKKMWCSFSTREHKKKEKYSCRQPSKSSTSRD